MPDKVRIRLVYPDGTDDEYWTFPGVNLWRSMAAHGIDVAGSCSGMGTCGRCKVRIEGRVSEQSDNERGYLLAEEIKSGERLACYCNVDESITVYLDYGDFGSDAKDKLFKERHQYQSSPRVNLRKIYIPGLDKDSPIPIQRRLKQALNGKQIRLSSKNWNELSSLDRVGRPTLELWALEWEQRTVKHIGREKKSAYGIALDIGSTSLFAALVDLQDGKVAAMASGTNMQRVYGADVISRISYCLENPDGLGKMRQVLLNSINTIVEELLQEAALSSSDLYEYAVAANPVMLHFLLGINPSGFAVAPYSGVVIDELDLGAAELGLIADGDTRVYILPQAGGFVGADTIAGLLTLEVKPSAAWMFIDIGTNGEIVLCHRGRLWAASAAAGPAFEGGGISSGARAGTGVVDRVDADDEGRLHFHIPGAQVARGICGSAVIDLMAVLLKLGYTDEKGIITPEAVDRLQIRESERGLEIVLLKTESGPPLVLNQEDIRQLQLAKAALRTAIDILMEKAGLDCRQLEKVYIAGAFGNYINPENAILVKMLPPVEPSKIINIGNTAAQGAVLALLSDAKRREARILQGKIECIELAHHPGFQEKFLHNLNF
ncbi:ASKHA domain-containing protein [Syntrophomonas curvata]